MIPCLLSPLDTQKSGHIAAKSKNISIFFRFGVVKRYCDAEKTRRGSGEPKASLFFEPVFGRFVSRRASPGSAYSLQIRQTEDTNHATLQTMVTGERELFTALS